MGVWVLQLTDQLPQLTKTQFLQPNLGLFLKLASLLGFLGFLDTFN